jgi:hypothetical protein
MALPTPQSPTLAAPRISLTKFTELLKSKNSPAVAEAPIVFNRLVEQGVDVSFALAQFRVESQYGTAGFAAETGSWGNMLWDRSLTILASGTLVKPVRLSDGTTRNYTYATYNNYLDAITDYARYIHWYITQYGLTTIYGATGRWIGHTGDAGHLAYVQNIINDMILYEYNPSTFQETGDKMISVSKYFDFTTGKFKATYPLNDGQTVYLGTNGNELKKLDFDTPTRDAWFLGEVNNSWEWGVVLIKPNTLNPLADTKGSAVYIKNPDPNKVKFI